MTNKPLHIGICGVGMAVPQRILTNHELEQMVETSDDWIITRTGIKERHIAAEGEASSDLGARAAQEALNDAKLTLNDIDLIIACSFTPDSCIPATACLIQAKLGSSKCAAFDLNAACTGFIYGLSAAHSMIKCGLARRALVIGTEVISRFTDYTDRNTCVLFGDGSGAVVLGPVEPPRGILSMYLGADGKGADLIKIEGGGSALPPSPKTLAEKKHYVQMAGSEVFKFAVRIMGDAVDEALKEAHLTSDQIDLLIPHQANIRIIEAAAKRYGLDNGRVMINVGQYGNTSAASIPIALCEARNQGRIREGNIVALVAFGGGLTWGSTIIRL